MFGQAVPDSIPGGYRLYRAMPNPFKISTVIGFDLPQETELRLVVYDLLGREMALLAEGIFTPAHHRIRWLGTDRWGRTAPSGIYIARLATPQYTKSIKMLLLK